MEPDAIARRQDIRISHVELFGKPEYKAALVEARPAVRASAGAFSTNP